MPVLSHRDLDPKNVLWRGLSPVLIDWEAAGYVRPKRELLEVALYWADDGRGGLDAALCAALLDAYAQHMPLGGNWTGAFAAGRTNLLEWLAYSIQQANGGQVEQTLAALGRYGENTQRLNDWLG